MPIDIDRDTTEYPLSESLKRAADVVLQIASEDSEGEDSSYSC
jgi:hypothetical protein